MKDIYRVNYLICYKSILHKRLHCVFFVLFNCIYKIRKNN